MLVGSYPATLQTVSPNVLNATIHYLSARLDHAVLFLLTKFRFMPCDSANHVTEMQTNSQHSIRLQGQIAAYHESA